MNEASETVIRARSPQVQSPPAALSWGAFVKEFFSPVLGHSEPPARNFGSRGLKRGALWWGLLQAGSGTNAAPRTLLLSPAVVGPVTYAPARASASCLFALTLARARSWVCRMSKDTGPGKAKMAEEE